MFLPENIVPGNEASPALTIDEQSLTQLEAMHLTDFDVYLHGASPNLLQALAHASLVGSAHLETTKVPAATLRGRQGVVYSN
jgi:hypothetical protein